MHKGHSPGTPAKKTADPGCRETTRYRDIETTDDAIGFCLDWIQLPRYRND
jgi:hypothetical protein